MHFPNSGEVTFRQRECDDTCNVWGCHRGAGNGIGAAVVPGGGDVNAGGDDVDAGAFFGEGGEAVGFVRGGNGDGFGHAGGGEFAGVAAGVAGGDGEDYAGFDGALDGAVEGFGSGTAEGHVCDGFAAGFGAFGCDELDAFDYAGGVAVAAGVEDFDGNQGGFFGNAVGFGADGSRDVGAVAVSVFVVVFYDGFADFGAALEFGVGDVDAGVDDVDVYSLCDLYSWSANGIVFHRTTTSSVNLPPAESGYV